MTELLFAAHKAGAVRVASVRGSDFFKPDDPIYGENVFAPARAGKAIKAIGSLDQPHTFTYTEDFGEALAIAGTNDAALGQAWHVPSEKPVTQRDLIALISEELGRPVRTQLDTPILMRLLGLFNPTLREMVEMMNGTVPILQDRKLPGFS